MKIVKGIQSEIFVPITPQSIFTLVTKELKEMKIALATAAGVHLKTEERFNFAGDFSYRIIPGNAKDEELMVSHGGYDNADVNKDINCMFPLSRLRELENKGVFKEISKIHIGFMGGGGDQEKFKKETGPQIARLFKEEGVDAVVLTAG